MKVGLFANFSDHFSEATSLVQTAQVASKNFGVYSQLTGDNGNYLMMAASGGFNRVRTRRDVTFGGAVTSSFGEYNGQQTGLFLEHGWDVKPVRNWLFQPVVGLQYAYIGQDGYTESGSGNLNLQVDSNDTNSLRSMIGFRASKEVQTQRGGLFTPEVRASWAHEFLDSSAVVASRFAWIRHNVCFQWRCDGRRLGTCRFRFEFPT